METLTFSPKEDASPPFFFLANGLQVSIVWNGMGERYYAQVTAQGGDRLSFRPLVNGEIYNGIEFDEEANLFKWTDTLNDGN